MTNYIVLVRGLRQPVQLSVSSLICEGDVLEVRGRNDELVAHYKLRSTHGFFQEIPVSAIARAKPDGSFDDQNVFDVKVRSRPKEFQIVADSVDDDGDRTIFRDASGRVVGNFESRSVDGHRRRSAVAIVMPSSQFQEAEPVEIVDIETARRA
jgi:hypothetical protein